jgi:class 3 adenylate cyclase
LAAREKDVSILFADLAGYTQMHELMEQQQTDRFVNRAFSEFVEDIQDFHGVLLSIYGDELFALFQDEDPIRHVRNACHAALSIARTAARFNESRSPGEPSVTVNMGINAGPAAVGLQPIEVATGARWRYDATGPTVNVAARIRALAHSGDILISAAAADRIEAEFQLQDRGEHVLRHVSKSVRVYRLLSARKDV